MSNIAFPPVQLPDSAPRIRESIRSLIARYSEGWPVGQRARSWTGVDYEFTRALGENGFIGMCWPRRYGGRECTALERYVVVEELLAAGAPVALHWAADRQIGPMLLRCGTEEQREAYLPAIARGEQWFCLGMSEPNSGSDLASVSTFATKVDGGYRINGSKIWTSGADRAQHMLLFCRTAERTEERHAGFSQIIVPLDAEGVEVTPIYDMSGHRTFNQVFFADAFVPAQNLVGVEGNGWKQVTSELSLERSGPDRFLSAFTLLDELAQALAASRDPVAAEALGRLVARLHFLRSMSISVADMLERGEDPSLQASIVKDLGSVFEQDIPEILRDVVDLGDPAVPHSLVLAARETMLIAPAYPLRGGTREILRGVIARGLGLR
ncbi:MAG: acyl-CoA dehydrogenase family protein [Novosphingobium sp.]